MNEEKEKSATCASWETRLSDAEACVERGDNYRARKILKTIINECPHFELKDRAMKLMNSSKSDYLFYIVWFISLATVIGTFIYYVLLK